MLEVPSTPSYDTPTRINKSIAYSVKETPIDAKPC